MGSLVVARVLLALGAAVAVSRVLQDFQGATSSGVYWALWVALPFGILLWASRAAPHRFSAAALLAAAVLYGACSAVSFSPSVTRSSSTASLVYIFIPLWQTLATGNILLIAYFFRRRDPLTNRCN